MFPPPPYGSASTSGARPPSCSAISNAAVFWPSIRFGFSELTRTNPPSSTIFRQLASAASKLPRTPRTLAPATRDCASFAAAIAPAGQSTTVVSPAAAP